MAVREDDVNAKVKEGWRRKEEISPSILYCESSYVGFRVGDMLTCRLS